METPRQPIPRQPETSSNEETPKEKKPPWVTLSLDDFVITFFTSGPDTVTFPVKVYSMVRFSVTPEINAASTILVLVTVVLTAIAMRFQKPDEAAK